MHGHILIFFGGTNTVVKSLAAVTKLYILMGESSAGWILVNYLLGDRINLAELNSLQVDI